MKAIDYESENARRINWLDITGGTSVTLLDAFAIAALEGLIGVIPKTTKDSELAEAAYLIAEAMLAERNKRFTPQGTVKGVTGKTYG